MDRAPDISLEQFSAKLFANKGKEEQEEQEQQEEQKERSARSVRPRRIGFVW